MINLPLYQVDAFAETPFSGNPAAVVLLPHWLDVETMQNIALENNLSETAFLVCNNDNFDIRYFTPLSEVDLCGHATLASAYVLFHIFHHPHQRLQFNTKNSGSLYVEKKEELLILDFPVDDLHKIDCEPEMVKALNAKPIEVYRGKNDLLLVYNSEEEIKKIQPIFELLIKLNARGIIVTALGNEVDFVSRFFAPKVGINEDPVTGSAHTTLIPYWSSRLKKKTLVAKQLSKRGGTLYCEMMGERVKIGGKAVHYLSGELTIQELKNDTTQN